MNIIEEVTEGKSYKAYKYSLDDADRPSVDYEDDRMIQWEKTAETVSHKSYIDLRKLCKQLISQEDQILSFFLDGSRRVFKVDDIAYQQSGGRNRIYPVIAGQIGVGCCKRTEKRMHVAIFKSEIVLSLPDIANADRKPGFFPATVRKINDTDELQKLKVNFSAIIPYKTAKNDETKLEDRATACVQDRMSELEKELVAELIREGKLDFNNYLVKDGSLEYRPSHEDKTDKKKYQTFKKNYNWVIGASKNFNPEVCVDIRGKPNPGFIADLPLYHRTPVACYENSEFLGDIKFAVWYIRLREQKQTRTPFDGILKVEKILVDDEETDVKGMSSDVVDRLSANLINERNPTCYGSDLRWANHIYPVYLTESFVKSRYLSNESFLHLF
ncbi:MAG: DNA double-strand break repair nuclease NurA [Treponema sp.]|jgi:hypothetical protein|nr:DNA double-strand break repair nuclease NurA [Treponema sp.]